MIISRYKGLNQEAIVNQSLKRSDTFKNPTPTYVLILDVPQYKPEIAQKHIEIKRNVSNKTPTQLRR